MRHLTIFFLLTIVFVSNAFAQLSPGDLSKSHESLEGIGNCNKCHGFEQKLAPEKCLACHETLEREIRAEKGLHSDQEHKDCGVCHVEHQGRDYDLVYWKDAQDHFDHSQTGYILEGKHAGVECRSCHKEKNIIRQNLIDEKIDPNRTFLGLDRQCLSCHDDEHRRQLSSNCVTCHTMAGWKPATAFDHSKAKFILTGKHAEVQCQKCHQSIVDNATPGGKAYIIFTGLEFGKCLDCHKDVHDNRFGQNCEGCHNTGGWANVNQVKFDHSKTKFALEGAHAAVECNKCHREGKPFKGLKFQACADCHGDYHQGQFAARERKGACEDCHTVAGFSLAKFTIEDHQKTSYPLAGSHLAVACNDCHDKEMISGNTETIRFKFERVRCQICHKDPHRGIVDSYLAKGGCEYCHLVESWKASSFDHSQTKFALVGRHKEVECAKCHNKRTDDAAQMRFSDLSVSCQGCHNDIHQGQFAEIKEVKAENNNGTDCARCHKPDSWKTLQFDHNRDSAFKLDGAHLELPCADCHKQVTFENKSFTRYKPLGKSCSSCHGDNINRTGEGKS